MAHGTILCGRYVVCRFAGANDSVVAGRAVAYVTAVIKNTTGKGTGRMAHTTIQGSGHMIFRLSGRRTVDVIVT